MQGGGRGERGGFGHEMEGPQSTVSHVHLIVPWAKANECVTRPSTTGSGQGAPCMEQCSWYMNTLINPSPIK